MLSPEDAAKKLVVSFDEEGCTLSAPGTTLPNQEVESRRLFEYPEVGGLFVSEDYMLVACKKAVSVCFAKSWPDGGISSGVSGFPGGEVWAPLGVLHPENQSTSGYAPVNGP